jgi:hypothetical protein
MEQVMHTHFDAAGTSDAAQLKYYLAPIPLLIQPKGSAQHGDFQVSVTFPFSCPFLYLCSYRSDHPSLGLHFFHVPCLSQHHYHAIFLCCDCALDLYPMMTSLKDCGSDWGSEAASWKNRVHHHTYLSAPMIFSLQNI